ncbi:TetR family transcriptional regulator [Tessaracoccus sp.]
MALTPERIVGASVAILDEYGLADLTMRRVGDALGVKAGALYWYFPNKQSLLAAVADEVLATCTDDGTGDGRQWLVGWAADVRERLLAHRDAAELVASTRAMGLGHVDPSRRLRAMLSRRGVSEDEADGVAQAFMHFVLGHVMEEQTQSQLAALGVIEGFDAQRAQRHFDWGVTVLVSGVEHATASPSAQVE